jgi:hypothetical protein
VTQQIETLWLVVIVSGEGGPPDLKEGTYGALSSPHYGQGFLVFRLIAYLVNTVGTYTECTVLLVIQYIL